MVANQTQIASIRNYLSFEKGFLENFSISTEITHAKEYQEIKKKQKRFQNLCD
jgi:hypothetical protein